MLRDLELTTRLEALLGRCSAVVPLMLGRCSEVALMLLQRSSVVELSLEAVSPKWARRNPGEPVMLGAVVFEVAKAADVAHSREDLPQSQPGALAVQQKRCLLSHRSMHSLA